MSQYKTIPIEKLYNWQKNGKNLENPTDRLTIERYLDTIISATPTEYIRNTFINYVQEKEKTELILKHERQINSKLQEEIKTLTKKLEENVKLVTNFRKNKKDYEIALKKKDEELETLTIKLYEANSTLEKYRSNIYISKILEVEKLSKEIEDKALLVRRKFLKESQDYQQQDYSELEKNISKHRDYQINLEKRCISYQKSEFSEMVCSFTNLRENRKKKIDNTLAAIDNIKNESESILSQPKLKISENFGEIAKFIKMQTEKLNDIQGTSFENDLQKERDLYKKLIPIAKEEINIYITLSENYRLSASQSNEGREVPE